MKHIRSSVFETNSSSVHAICIPKNDNVYVPKEVYFGHGEFGWSERLLSTLLDKAAYLNEAINSLEYDESEKFREKLCYILKRHKIDVTFENNVYEIYSSGHSYYHSGYIDHSVCLYDWIVDLLNDEDKLMRYLFSNDSVVITGNDNSDNELMGEVLKDKPDSKYDIYYKGN